MKRMTLKQIQRAVSAVNYIGADNGRQTRAEEDVEIQMKKVIAWACFAQGFAYDPATNRVKEPEA